jgi:hypothetical protein
VLLRVRIGSVEYEMLVVVYKKTTEIALWKGGRRREML